MKVPKGADIELKTTEDGTIELHVTAALITRSQAADLIKCIRQASGALERDRRNTRKATKITEAAA